MTPPESSTRNVAPVLTVTAEVATFVPVVVKESVPAETVVEPDQVSAVVRESVPTPSLFRLPVWPAMLATMPDSRQRAAGHVDGRARVDRDRPRLGGGHVGILERTPG